METSFPEPLEPSFECSLRTVKKNKWPPKYQKNARQMV